MNTTRPGTTTRRMRRIVTVIAIGAGVLMVGACTAEQRRGLGEIDVREVLHDRVEQAVADGGQKIDGDLDCHSQIDGDGKVAASCVGVTESGNDVTGSFAGTADVEAEHCAASLTITVGDDAVVTDPDALCFAD